jgi:hypothetical protein
LNRITQFFICLCAYWNAQRPIIKQAGTKEEYEEEDKETRKTRNKALRQYNNRVSEITVTIMQREEMNIHIFLSYK